jgi:hypothetical protein
MRVVNMILLQVNFTLRRSQVHDLSARPFLCLYDYEIMRYDYEGGTSIIANKMINNLAIQRIQMILPDTVVQSSKDIPCREHNAGYRPIHLSGRLPPNRETAVLDVPGSGTVVVIVNSISFTPLNS